jgi:hypothetical protein
VFVADPHPGVFPAAQPSPTGPGLAGRRRPPGGDLERRQPGELTPAERAIRRRNRRWLVFIAVPALVLGVAALVASLVASQATPSVAPLRVAPGYRAVSDGTFAYAVPVGWSMSSAYSDDVGDLDTAGRSGWVAEHLDGRTSAPAPGEKPPGAFEAFGEGVPTPYSISGPRPMSLHGTTVAYRYLVTRPGGFRATAVDAWQASSDTEIWLLIDASPATTAEVLASFN